MTEAVPAKQVHLSPNQRAWRRFKRNRPAVISGWFLLALTLFILGISAVQWSLNESKEDGSLKKTIRSLASSLPKAMRTPPNTVGNEMFSSPTATHWFGTDIHGRDLFSRVFAGARISLLVGLVGTAVAFVIGVTWGAVSGYVGGKLDNAMMRFVDIMYSLPSIIFVIVLITSLGGLLQDNLNPRVRLTDFREPTTFFYDLGHPNATGPTMLLGKLSEPVQQQLKALRNSEEPAEELQKAVTGEFNKLLEGANPLFTAEQRASLKLRSKTTDLAAMNPKGQDLTRLNRFLLEDTFPTQLKQRETWIALALAKVFPPDSSAVIQIMFLFIGLGAVSWLTMARIVRGQVLSLRHRQFVDASRSLGATHGRLLLRHILPNVYGIIIVYLTLTLPAIILYESFLSYLGLGIQPPMASWGSLIAEGAQQLNSIRIYWWLLVFPSGALISTLLALNFLGDGLRDAFEPKGGD